MVINKVVIISRLEIKLINYLYCLNADSCSWRILVLRDGVANTSTAAPCLPSKRKVLIKPPRIRRSI